jgi:hypothetical protein
VVEQNQIELVAKKANELDFEKLFQDNLPTEAQDLHDFIQKMNQRNTNKTQ